MPMPLFHIALNGLLILLFGFLGWISFRKERKLTLYLLVFLLILEGVQFYLLNRRPDLYTSILPFSGIIFYFNLYPFVVAFAVPILLRLGKEKMQKIRIGMLCLVMFFLSLVPYRYYFLEPAESTRNIFDPNGVCIQSSPDTCSAAAAVTLLRVYGIETTEAGMIRLALTKKKKGTDRLGLYRGLKIMTAGRPDLEVNIMQTSCRELIERNIPALITVGLTREPSTDIEIELRDRYQWKPGSMHDVVFLGTDDDHPGQIKIGEPQFGMETWPAPHLGALYKGMAVYLE